MKYSERMQIFKIPILKNDKEKKIYREEKKIKLFKSITILSKCKSQLYDVTQSKN